MPPGQDDARERQLDALRRYVSDLDIRRRDDSPPLPPARLRRRFSWPWLLVTLALMAVSLAGGIAIGTGREPAGRGSELVATTASSVAAPTASPECAEAVERANRTISHAVLVSAALREHTEAMNKLRDGRPDPEAAVKAGTPSLIAGSAESAKFDVALADYRKVVDRCQLQTP